MAKPSKTRAVNDGPELEVAQQRYALYTKAIGKVQGAIEAGFFLEAITLTESLIADRLEARLAAIYDQEPSKREFGTLGYLYGQLNAKTVSETEACKSLYSEVDRWRVRRNEALHQLVKLAEEDDRDWDERYAEAEQTARDGLDLFRRLDRETAKHNRPS